MSKEGILIEGFDPKPVIKKNAETAYDWEYTEEAKLLYGIIEEITEKFGIHKDALYQRVKTDDEFFEVLEILQDIQKDDIFKTGTIEDNQVYEAMLALLLSETIHRHDRSSDS